MASDASWALEKQFDRIIAEHSRAIWRLACSYEPVAGRREELMQDIALALWQALPHFRGECSERTFVFRIAHNRGLSHIWKRKPAHESIDKLPERDHPIDERPEPEEQAAQECRRVALMSAVRSLPVTYRQMILLMLEDLSHAEMAEIVGITERNVAVRLNRARKALKEALEGQS
ncbi:MAG: RNA polymerase sigma factor [Acidobacteriaceae bacterium]|nr:RNA polymerase sigma factor [Acidobacteriaceae bacterium]